jgi:hypothetical protein
MRSLVLAVVGILASAAPAAAQFSAYYEGTTQTDGRDQPLTTRFSVEKGRVAAVMTGARSFRMIYAEKDGVLRVIDDTGKSYFDLDRGSLEAFTGGAMAEARKQMADAPPEQRAMMEKMLQGSMGAMKQTPVTYVWSRETQTVNGYPCTRVDVMRGEEKRAEYWGSTSPDFKLSDAERHTVMAMNDCLNGLAIMARGADGGTETRPFQWDTSTDGYPLISRCFDGDVKTLDIHLVRFDRKPLDDDLFAAPAGYQKKELGGLESGKGRGHRH